MLEKIGIKNLDHLGIVAGIIDDLEIEKIVNQELGINHKEKISAGKIVKAIILNGLGFVSAPLYLFPQFFQDKPVEKLLGEGIKAEYINDDKIGRVMDELWNYGLEKIWTHIAINTIKKYQIQEKYLHLDSTSISVKGDYLKSKDSSETITVTYGYSKDKRPDLKQFMVDLIVSNDGDIPLLIKIGSGNQSDKKMFTERIKEYQENINQENKDITYIADSALYTAENLQKLKQIKWISRVPITIKKAKKLLEIKEENNWIISEKVGYSYQEHEVNYQGIEQRWLIVLSEARKESDLKKLNKNCEKEEQKIQEQIKKWTTRKKKSLEELEQEVKAFKKKLAFYELKVIDYKKELNSQKEEVYSATFEIKINQEKISLEKNKAGKFILATNVLNKEELPSEELLLQYKNQQSCERGFRFLKDPLFLASSTFVKNEKRIETMGVLMGLCLLVYNLGQRMLRKELVASGTKVKKPDGKLTDKPTLKIIFQKFQGVHLVKLSGKIFVSNLNDELLTILKYFTVYCQNYYQ